MKQFTAPDGRTIAWCEYGDPHGRPLVVAHGTPGSRLQAAPIDEAARTAGLRVIAPDRPGCGHTDPAPDTGFHDWDADYAALLDHLGLDSAFLAGISGGAGYALAAAQTHPGRVRRLVLACGMAPGAPRSALRHRIRVVSLLYWMCRHLPRVAEAALAGTGPFKYARASAIDAFPPADKLIAANPEAVAAAGRDAAEGVRQGARAAVRDLARYRNPLPAPLSTITVPTVFLHGGQDGNVPIGVARWACAQIPGSRLIELPGAGHLFLSADATPLVEAVS